MTKIKSTKKGANKKLLSIFIVTSLMAGPTGYIWAAEGLQAQFTLSQRLEHTDEEGATSNDDEGVISRTDLGFQLTSETSTERLQLNVGTSLTYNITNSNASKRFDFEDPSLRLSYAIESRSSILTFDGSYRSVDVDQSAFLDNLDADTDIITGDGKRETLSLSTGLVVGREAPLSLSLDHSFRQTNYSGTTDPSLVDIDTHSVNARLTFQLSPVASTYVFAALSDTDAAGAGSSDRTSRRYGIGGSYAISPSLTATAEISHQNIDSDDNAGALTNTNGVGYKFGLSQERPNGVLSFNFEEEETVNGKRRQITFGRDFEFKRGTIAFAVGATKTDGLKIAPLVNASVNYELDTLSTIGLTLSQSSRVNDDDETTISSRLGLTYARELSDLSRITASLNVVDTNAQTVGGEDQKSIRLNLSHRYALAREWDLVSGYTYSKTNRDTQADRKTSTIFVGLEKTFAFRP